MIANRRELLFLYDVSWANPNGDPDDENRPRIDEETGINIVRDARIKRTIRDQILAMNLDKEKFNVFFKEEYFTEGKNKGKLKTRTELLDKKTLGELLNQYVDLRLFGFTFSVKNKEKNNSDDIPQSSLTGPIQFKHGQSMHRVVVKTIKGTTVLPSGENKNQGTFSTSYVVPYSLIKVHGIINEQASQSTKLTDEDVDIMLEALWLGHKTNTSIITGSKFGHMPRLLIEIVYKPGMLVHIGELDKYIKIDTTKTDEEIRDIADVKIDLTLLRNEIAKYKDKIDAIYYVMNDRVQLICDGQDKTSIKDVFKNVIEEDKVKKFDWSSKYEASNF